MAENISDVKEVKIKALDAFLKEFGEEATHCVCAPGRVNVIGEHTDYNEGFVLPMALPMVTVIAGKPNGTNICTIISASSAVTSVSKAEFDISEPAAIKPGEPKWANYVKGCIVNFTNSLPGFNAVVISTVPVGAGLSSSAALEVATYTFLEAITGQVANPVEKAISCQKAEHDFAGVPCGIMDQFISVMGQDGHALLLDCRDKSVIQIHMENLKDHLFLITNSNSPHKLSSSAYRDRRDACFEAAKMLGKNSLRDVSLEDIKTLEKQGASKVTINRVRHVLNENLRTQAAMKALQAGDYKRLGELMNESHDSLRDNYEVSSPELDTLVNTARSVDGVLGSRLTGAGFGGCTITLLKEECISKVISKIKDTYTGKATFYMAKPSAGARRLDCHR
ncbi:galactokinase-like [Diachasmimorpha longicaudata]|uniref:galactokinase-like n=1 Tax=Diachasmimorpha longicaudata TaxID=58733 RepID=UPI0030B8C423